MFFLLLGHDRPAKDHKLTELKHSICPTQDALHFDCQTLYGHKLEAEEFKKALIALPVYGDQRLVILFQLEKLSKQNEHILIDVLEEKPKQLALILDSDELTQDSALVKKIASHVQITTAGHIQKKNVFDMTRLLGSGKVADALKVLHELYAQGEHPLKIMGGVIWFWGKQKNRLNVDSYQKGLLELQEADQNIKRTRLKPEYALEKALVKLSLLLKA